jgi:hypothetical protein
MFETDKRTAFKLLHSMTDRVFSFELDNMLSQLADMLVLDSSDESLLTLLPQFLKNQRISNIILKGLFKDSAPVFIKELDVLSGRSETAFCILSSLACKSNFWRIMSQGLFFSPIFYNQCVEYRGKKELESKDHSSCYQQCRMDQRRANFIRKIFIAGHSC